MVAVVFSRGAPAGILTESAGLSAKQDAAVASHWGAIRTAEHLGAAADVEAGGVGVAGVGLGLAGHGVRGEEGRADDGGGHEGRERGGAFACGGHVVVVFPVRRYLLVRISTRTNSRPSGSAASPAAFHSPLPTSRFCVAPSVVSCTAVSWPASPFTP